MVLGLVAIATIMSCQKKEDCWSCERETLTGGKMYKYTDYCGTIEGMRELEHKVVDAHYTHYRCTLK